VHLALEKGLATRPEFRFESMAALLRALERDTRPAVRWAPMGIAVMLLLGLTGGAWWRSSSARTRACKESLTAFDQVWTPTSRQRALDAYLAALPKMGQAGFARVEASLELWGASWKEVHRSVCEGASGRTLDPATSATLSCLERLKSSEVALVNALAEVDGTSALAENEAVAALEPARRCAQSSTLIESAIAEKVHTQLAESTVLLALTRAEAARVRAESAAQAAHAAGLYADEARGWVRVAAAQTQASKLNDADASLVNALVAAQQAGDLGLMADAWADRMVDAALYGAQFDRALEYGRFADAVLSRTGPQPAVQSRLLMARGYVLTQTGNPEAAEDMLDHAIALEERGSGLENIASMRTLMLLANAERLAGHLDAALETLDRVDALQARILSPQHPHMASAKNARGRVLLARGDADKALVAHEEARAIEEAALKGPHLEKVKTLALIGEAQRERGAKADAEAAFRAALEQAQPLMSPEHPLRAGLERDLGRLLLEAGRAQPALDAFTTSEAGPWKGPDRAELATLEARALLELNRPAEAQRRAEDSLVTLETAAAHFVLAQALWAQQQKSHALSEAESALKSADTALAAQVKTWRDAVTAPPPKPKKRGR
jgi:tetratricopeptide (TPR) repeat protein